MIHKIFTIILILQTACLNAQVIDDASTLNFGDLITSNSFLEKLPNMKIEMDIDDFYSKRKEIKRSLGSFDNGWVTTFEGCKVQLYGKPGNVRFGYSFEGNCTSGYANGDGIIYRFKGSNYSPVSINSFIQANYKNGVPVSNIYGCSGSKLTLIYKPNNVNSTLRITIEFKKPYNRLYSREQATLLIQNLIPIVNLKQTILELKGLWEENNLNTYFRTVLIAECKAVPEMSPHELYFAREGESLYIVGKKSGDSPNEISKSFIKNKKRIREEIFTLYQNQIVISEWSHGEMNIVSKQNLGEELVIDHCESGDCHDGNGTYVYASGHKYEGEFKNGKFHGKGTYLYKDGKKYTGDFVDGEYHGQGKFLYSSGSNGYVGEYKNGKRHGKGRVFGMFMAVDNKKGYWVNGKYHGRYPPQDYSNHKYKLDEINENTYWYDIYDGNTKVAHLQISTNYNNSGTIDISTFLGKEFSISGIYDPSYKTLYKDKGTEKNIPNLQAAIERLLSLKLEN